MSIFVFGSNLAGRHGRGAARFALKNHGAKYGIGVGIQGGAYGIPTKGYRMEVLPLDVISSHVEEFLKFAEARPDTVFNVTAIGCGLAGYSPQEIAPMFSGHTINCIMPEEFNEFI